MHVGKRSAQEVLAAYYRRSLDGGVYCTALRYEYVAIGHVDAAASTLDDYLRTDLEIIG